MGLLRSMYIKHLHAFRGSELKENIGERFRLAETLLSQHLFDCGTNVPWPQHWAESEDLTDVSFSNDLIKCCNVLESLLFGHPIWICLLKGRGHCF